MAEKLKVYGCHTDDGYRGGLIIVAAPNKRQAFLTAVSSKQTRWLFGKYWDSDDWESEIFPFEKWKELNHLQTDLTEPQIISEYHYSC